MVPSLHIASPTVSGAFNTNAIVYDNTPWRPGRDIALEQRSAEDERKLKNLATRIMSNGVEVLVRDKSTDGKQEQRKFKLMHLAPLKPSNNGVNSSPPYKSLLSSAVATVVNRQEISAFFPLHQLMQHNYIIKTCMTTYTYLTTVIQNKRSAVSTFETIVSVVTTESLTNLYATEVLADIKPTKTKYMEVKTIQPSASNVYLSNIPKLDKRIDNQEEHNFDLIQPSEISHGLCTTSCTCSHTKTESLKTRYSNIKQTSSPTQDKYHLKSTKYSGTKLDVRPTHKETFNKTQYHPYEYETSSQGAPTDKIVEKYTQVTDYLDEKESASLEASDLLTNEQAPPPLKNNKVTSNKTSENVKPDRPQKVNKNKFVMAELIKLGSLGIKGLSQLGPVIEKMTGGFMKRQELNKTTTTTTTTTVKPIVKVTSYKANKRVDSDLESKHGNFPIYIPVDELETSESQTVFTNATLHQNFAWAVENKLSKAHFPKTKIVHESPLVNGGIPISPGDIITANSDVIVGKPAVGGPLTLVASGIKLQNPVQPPPIDNIVANSDQYINKEILPFRQTVVASNIDDSFDLRPPELPNLKIKPNKISLRPQDVYFDQQNKHVVSSRLPVAFHMNNAPMTHPGLKNNNNPVLINHVRPAFLDFIPSLAKPIGSSTIDNSVNYRPHLEINEENDIPDNNPSSSEIVSTKIITDDKYENVDTHVSINKPFLVDIQPSKVANVLIPHGSSTALVFAGSSEPHKTGDYVDDPLPYPEPGYFGSFSIDAPHMTNVHNVVPNKNIFLVKPNAHPTMETFKYNAPSYKEEKPNNEFKVKFNENKRPKDLNKLPPPTSKQEAHIQIGPQITAYNPELYKNDFEKQRQTVINNNSKEPKDAIDKEYENYLAVPPPPRKLQFNQENRYNKNKAYHYQTPIIHTKPIHETNFFSNVEHPVSNQLLPKVTSEIYFASQLPNSQPTPTYTFKIPQAVSAIGNTKPKLSNNNKQLPNSGNHNNIPNSFIVSSPNTADKPTVHSNGKENTYTITLNTATNVASEGNSGHVMGSSVSVPITTTSHNGQINANIPIGTNFAIRVEDDPEKYESVALHGKRHPSLIYDGHGSIPINGFNVIYVNTTSSMLNSDQSTISNIKKVKDEYVRNEVYPLTSSSVNSHANFPVINEEVSPNIKLKPVVKDNKYLFNHDKIPQSVQNNATNSHGWYSSILKEGNVKNIRVEITTRKNIPLNYDVRKDSVPDFGQKITSVGKPPTDFGYQNNKQSINNFGVGKPFSKPKVDQTLNIATFTVKPNYIPSIYGVRQPTYDIPMRDNSDETTTPKYSYQQPLKAVYETAEEIYDGEEGPELSGEIEGEVSSESMRVPYVSSTKAKNVTKESAIAVPQNIIPSTFGHSNNNNQYLIMTTGTQTEKPFISNNKTAFHSNSVKPMYENPNIYMKPRPFALNTALPLDHQLQQPHWQINQLTENATNNMSLEGNIELNIGEEINEISTNTPISAGNLLQSKVIENKNKTHTSSRDSLLHNHTRIYNDSNIITSNVHIKDKKPLRVEIDHKSTLPAFSITSQMEQNSSSHEIIDLSPPPTEDYHYRPLKSVEIMGMSPPPPRTATQRYPTRSTQTPRPALPTRTPPPYRTLPPRTLPPRHSSPRPVRKPISRDEVSTYRPSYDLINKVKRPSFNYEQPSSHLQPPPRELSSQIISTENILKLTSTLSPTTSIIFPTSLSSRWLTSSNIEFSSSFNFVPTSVHYPETALQHQEEPNVISSQTLENIDSFYDYESSSESINFEHPVTEKKTAILKETNSSPLGNVTKIFAANSVQFNGSSFSLSDASKEESHENKFKLTSIGNKTRTRKPYPIRHDDKKISTAKLKIPSKTDSVIKPSRTLTRPEISYPPRISSIKKNIRPLPSKPLTSFSSSVIESSESIMEDDFIRPTEVLKDVEVSTMSPEIISIIEKTVTSTLIISKDILDSNRKPTHHAGNEIKISDEIVPTKTEFRTTIITLTKTLSEPPQTVSSIGYLNLTQTLTVTHTKTSLVSHSEGAVTETLVLTNTQTSTIVDVVTEIYTQVQPTTIVETVTKHIAIPQVEPTAVVDSVTSTQIALDDLTMSSEESDNFIIKDNDVTENIQKIEIEEEKENDTFFVVMNKSQNGGKSPPIATDIETGDYDTITRNEQVNNNGVSQVLFGEILLAGTPYLETINVARPTVTGYGKECQPDCKASRNERCQRIDGVMKCVCRPGFARMFPDRPCKPTYTYSVKLALRSQGNELLKFQKYLSDNSSKEYQTLAVATHEGINRMIMQSDLRDVYHGVHITGFNPIDVKTPEGGLYEGVINDFYVQLSDNAHESRLKEVIEKYLRNNNYSLGGTEVHAADELMDKLNVSDFDECISSQFHDCSEHARCFNLRGTYTCSCLEGFADLSVNTLYPGRLCSSDAVGCADCSYHGTCFERESAMICECFKWYAGRTCQVNLKAVLITVTAIGAVIILVVTIWASKRCCSQRGPTTQTFVIGCMQGMPTLHQANLPSKQRADRRALIAERTEAAETCSVQNTSLPYIPSKQSRSVCSKKCAISDPPAHAPPPPPAPALMIPRARLHPLHSDSRDNLSRKKSAEACSEAKLISYLESGAVNVNEEMRRKHSVESSYSMNKERSNKQGALVSAGFKVSTTVRPDENSIKEHRDDTSSVNKTDLDAELSHFDTLRKYDSQEDMSEWTDAERRIGELTLSEARSVGGTLPASTGRAASSTRLTHQEANTMAERDLGSTFLLPHVHLYKPDITSDVSEFDSL